MQEETTWTYFKRNKHIYTDQLAVPAQYTQHQISKWSFDSNSDHFAAKMWYTEGSFDSNTELKPDINIGHLTVTLNCTGSQASGNIKHK